MKYVDADTLHACRDAIRTGATLQFIATRLTIDVSELARLLSWEGIRAEVPDRSPESVDLWAWDARDEIL